MLRNEGDRLTKVVVCTPYKEYFQVTIRDYLFDNYGYDYDEPSGYSACL